MQKRQKNWTASQENSYKIKNYFQNEHCVRCEDVILHQNQKTNDLEEECYYEEERTYDNNNSSYAQDVEGWSDQDIDDVFDGDHDAYWNIY